MVERLSDLLDYRGSMCGTGPRGTILCGFICGECVFQGRVPRGHITTYHSMRPVVVFLYVVEVGGAVESRVVPIQLTQPA